VVGAALQRRGGVARHDVVAWGYARGADAFGVDIIQNCEVLGFRRDAAGAIAGVETSKGYIRTARVAWWRRAHSVVMARAGLRMPIESFPLQALVSEPVKPVFPCVVMSNTIHAYISQSDKGELVIGAGTDQYISYSQQGGLHIATHTLEAICELFPQFSRLRMLRNWGGIVDVTPTARRSSHHADPWPLRELRLGHRRLQGDAVLGPGLRPHHRQGEPHAINAPFTLDRFRTAASSTRRRPRPSPTEPGHAPDRLPALRPPPEIEFQCGGEAHIARPADLARSATTIGAFPLLSHQPEGRACRALAACARLPALVQRAARHRERQDRRHLCDGRARPEWRSDSPPLTGGLGVG